MKHDYCRIVVKDKAQLHLAIRYAELMGLKPYSTKQKSIDYCTRYIRHDRIMVCIFLDFVNGEYSGDILYSLTGVCYSITNDRTTFTDEEITAIMLGWNPFEMVNE